MYSSLHIILLLLLLALAGPSIAKLNCPLYGLGYPKPTDLLSAPGVRAAAAALDSVFPQYIDAATGDDSVGADRFSYAVEVFSATTDAPLWSHYWTAPDLAALNSTGVRRVDGDTVFRLGSVTKVYTILALLAEVGDGCWNDPVTKYVPELAAFAAATEGSGGGGGGSADGRHHAIWKPDWEAITIGALASQLSGLTRDYALLGELTQEFNRTDVVDIGFPPIQDVEVPPCGNYPVCNRTEFFEGLKRTPPSFSPFVTPAYSDVGYALLAYAVESMAGKSFQSIVEDRIIKPLDLKRTFYKTPNDTLGVIPGGRYKTNWAFDMGNESPTGNMYASPSDLSAVGRAILGSTLMPAAMTRRWLKPASFSSDPKSAVGSPWGVRQLALPSNSTYQFATTFNKAGSLGKYSALLAVIPDFDIGFTVMAAGDIPGGLAMSLADTLASTYLPTMQYTAREQASATYGGEYRSSSASASDSSGSSTTNSSLSVGVDSLRPGLGVDRWVSNGTDLMGLAVALGQNVSREYWGRMRPSVRLYPTGLWDARPEGGGRRVAFKAVFEDLGLANVTQPYSTDCATWVSVGGIMYGSKPLDLFVFDVDAEGRVTSVENAALRAKLDKVE